MRQRETSHRISHRTQREAREGKRPAPRPAALALPTAWQHHTNTAQYCEQTPASTKRAMALSGMFNPPTRRGEPSRDRREVHTVLALAETEVEVLQHFARFAIKSGTTVAKFSTRHRRTIGRYLRRPVSSVLDMTHEARRQLA
eukprot:1671943-Rhodomonas_salina.2